MTVPDGIAEIIGALDAGPLPATRSIALPEHRPSMTPIP